MIEHTSVISGIATYKGKYVGTAGYDNRVILWDAETGKGLARGWHDHLANQCNFSPDGKYLASSGSDYIGRIWSLPDMRLVALLGDHEDDVEGIVFHAEKPLIATSSRDTHVRVFDLDGNLVTKMSGHTADVISVEWLGDNELISTSDDGTIKRWNATTGEMTEDIDLGGVETDTIAISREGFIFAGNDEGQIISIVNGQKTFVDAHNAGIKRVVYDAGQSALVSLSYDRSVRIWSTDENGNLTALHSASLPPVIWPRSCAFLDADNVVFVTFGTTYGIYNYKTATWSIDHIQPTLGKNAVCDHNGELYSVGDAGIIFRGNEEVCTVPSLCNFITPFGATMIVGGQTGQIFDAQTGELYHTHRSPLNCAAAFESEGKSKLIIGSYTGEGIVLSLEDGKVVYDRTVNIHENAIKGIAASKDYIFSVAADAAAAFNSTEDFSATKFIPDAHDKIANGCAAMSDNVFVSISRDLRLRVWRQFEAEVIESPHKNSIKCIAMTRDGRYVATGNYTGYLGIYDLETREWSTWERLASAGISSLALSDDGQSFLASSYNGKIYTVPVAAAVLV